MGPVPLGSWAWGRMPERAHTPVGVRIQVCFPELGDMPEGVYYSLCFLGTGLFAAPAMQSSLASSWSSA